jgi:hypothetical protein
MGLSVNQAFNATPIGVITAFHKTFTNTPTLPWGWVECNGQTLSDAESVFNGQVIPNLNAANRFLRGATTSGTTGGADTHTHTITTSTTSASISGAGTTVVTGVTSPSGNNSTLNPSYFQVVWVMRVK